MAAIKLHRSEVEMLPPKSNVIHIWNEHKVTGVLWLTNQRMAFRPDSNNKDYIELNSWDVYYASICSIKKYTSPTDKSENLQYIRVSTMKFQTYSIALYSDSHDKSCLIRFIKKCRRSPYVKQSERSQSYSDTSEQMSPWELVICRDGNFKMSDINFGYRLSIYYPVFIFVPNSVTVQQARSSAATREFGQLMLVVWAQTSGALLFRTLYNRASKMSAGDFIWIRAHALKCPKKTIKFLNIGTRNTFHLEYEDFKSEYLDLPNDSIIQLAFNEIRDSIRYGRRFYHQTQATWLEIHSKILEVASRIAVCLESDESICIQATGKSFIQFPVITIIQILSDPYFRTINGISSLIEKDWINCHFPFQRHLESHNFPYFEIFVHNLWMIWSYYPLEFEFNKSFLHFLLDALYSMRYSTFLFNEHKSRSQSRITLPTIFEEIKKKRSKFHNPAYKPHRGLLRVENLIKRPIIWASRILKYNLDARIDGNKACEECTFSNGERSYELRPPYKWTDIPEKLIKLDNLVALYLESANFTYLPDELIVARSLKRLSFSDNPIRHIPEDWMMMIGSNLTNLQYLNLDMICAQVYPENIQNNIPSLVHFKFNKTDLEDQEELAVPFNIVPSDVNNMQIIELSYNKLASFPLPLAFITKLTTVILSNNNLTQLPSQINSLRNLEKIDLSSNAITSLELPASEKYRLTSLKQLILSDNQISSLPSDIGHFPSLVKVDLSRNKLEKIPNKVFLSFSNVRALNLSYNKILQLDNSIGHLKKLSHLELGHNLLKSTPTAIVGLKKLRYLDLSYNQLRILNGAVGVMSSLRHLDISFNLLTELPIQLGMIKKTLKKLKIEGNDLNMLPQRTLEQDPKSVLNHLYDLAYSNKPKYQIKAMIFGEENVGKTTLVNQIIKYWNVGNIESIFEVAPSLSTDGIVISGSSFVWKNTEENKVAGLPSEVEIKVNWWDFAGQELYYTTHQLFLSSRTLFIVVWNLKKNIQSSKVMFWLNSIRSKVSSATVILVGTHLDRVRESKKKELKSYIYSNKVRLRLLFQSLSITVVCVSTRTGEGMKEFKDLLEKKIVNSSYLKEVFPTSYLLLEQSIIDARKEKTIPIMMRHEFKMLATMCAVPEKSLSRALKLLHCLGSLYLDKDSEIPYYIVIDPQWLAKMLATLITTKHSFVHAGIISHWSLKHIWKDLPVKHYEYLLGLFEKFELCYSLSEYVDLNDMKMKITKRGHLSKGGKYAHKLKIGSPTSQKTQSSGSADSEGTPESAPSAHSSPRSNNSADSKQVKQPESRSPEPSSDSVLQTESGNGDSVNMRMTFKILEKDRFEKFNWDGFSLVPSVLPSEFPVYVESDPELILKESEYEANRLYIFEFIPDGLFSRLMVRLLQSFLDQSLEFICWKTGIIFLRQNDKIFVTVKSNGEHEFLEMIVRSENFFHHGKVFCTLLEICGTLFDEWQCLNIQHKIMCTRCRKAGVASPFHFLLDEVLRAMRKGESCIYCRSQHGNQHCVKIEELVPEAELIYIEGSKIAYEDISFGSVIGQGGFAIVYKGFYKNQEVAIKCFKTQLGMQEGEHTYEGVSKEFNEFRKEAFMMLDIDNLYCVKLIGVCLKPFSMVTELIKHSDLYTLCNNRDIPFKWPLKLKIALDVARGLDYLHSQKPSIIHNDFKSPNILLTSLDPKQSVCAKISDFGLSVHGTKMYTRMVDTPIWLAPEILKGQTYGCKADIYAYGVILWEMLERKKYFEELAFNSEVEFHVMDGIRPEITQECFPEYETLIRTCWDDDPRKRPTSTKIVALVEQIICKYENEQQNDDI